ncbi:MAG: hypothetical protein J6M05_00630 [Cardiobacteriaceae bacterium]|nr:hypothetical protein [Cardiobacteriaceae bacterium]
MKIETMKGRQENSGYSRVFNDKELGFLLSKVQATVISNGNELEKIILSQCNVIEELNFFIDRVAENNIEDGIFVCEKKAIKNSRYAIGIDPDLLIFIVGKKKVCKVIELKDGDSFDTKKSKGEKDNLQKFATVFGAKIPFITEYYICCFNQLDKEQIRQGFKNCFELENIMTGKELCEILRIDYEKIIADRNKDAQSNLEYFVENLLKIQSVRELIEEKLSA